jgi:copper chaperone CopZ
MRYLIAISLALGLAASGASAASDQPTAGEAAAATEYVLGVEGMSCAINCAPAVKSSLESLPGVRSVEIDFESKKAIVKTDPDVELTTEACDKSFDNQGYFVSSIEKRAPEAEVSAP